VKVQRVVTAVVVLALIPLAAQIPALASLALVAFILVALIALESVWFRDSRERIRHEEDDAISHLQHGG